MEEILRNFLLSRDVAKDTVQKMDSEKIDIEAIMGMPTEELKEYIPTCGDRIAVINFCRQQSSGSKCATRTLSLLEKLKRGQKIVSDEDETKPKKHKDFDTTRRSFGRKPQTTRKILIGWILNGKPVRQSRGGGCRDVTVNKSAKKEDILQIAKDLFYPKGESIHGKLINYEYDLLDFQQSSFQDSLTVGQIYEITKLNVLRFYLSTNEKKKETKTTQPYKLRSASGERKMDASEFVKEANSLTLQTTNLLNWLGNHDDQAANLNKENSFILFDESTSSAVNGIIDSVFEDTDVNETVNVNNDSFLNLEFSLGTDVSDAQDIILLRLHRGRIFEELLNAFQDEISSMENIKIEMILPNGEIEKGDDQGGIFRDSLAEFWGTFYEKCTIGTDLKVPCLRHDFGEKEWKAIAKILIKGYLVEKYFPIKLAPVFIENCLGKTHIDDETLLDNFKKVVSGTDADTINEALNNFNSSNEEILDFFTMYESKWLPTANNVNKLIRDIAHRELIQKPAFVGRCFSEEFRKKKTSLDVFQVQKLYQDLKPSTKNCLAKIILEDENLNSMKKEQFLKRFIKEANDRLRSLFVRFCTGSDLPVIEIKVSFDELPSSEFKRTPIAHTCSGVLILPLGYESYIDFRSDFNNILTSNIWIMDIV